MADDLTTLEPDAPQDEERFSPYSATELGLDTAVKSQALPGEATIGEYKPSAGDSLKQGFENTTGFAQQFKEYFAAKTVERAKAHGVAKPQGSVSADGVFTGTGDAPDVFNSNQPSQAEYDAALQTLGIAHQRKEADDSFHSDGLGGKIAYGVGALGKGIAQPENLLQVGGIAKTVQGAWAAKSAGAALVQSMLAHGAEAGVTNLGIDAVSQGLEIGAGLEDKWSWERSGMAFGVGAALGGGMSGAATAIGRVLEARRMGQMFRDAPAERPSFADPSRAGEAPSSYLVTPPELNRFKPLPDDARLATSNPDLAPGVAETADAIASRAQRGDGFDPRSVLPPDDPALQAPPLDVRAGEAKPDQILAPEDRAAAEAIGGPGAADELERAIAPPPEVRPSLDAEVAPREPGAPMGEPGLVARGADASDVKNQWRAETPYKDVEEFLGNSKANQAEVGAHGRQIAGDMGALDFGDPGVKAPTTAEIEALHAKAAGLPPDATPEQIKEAKEAAGKAEKKFARLLRKITDQDGQVVKAPGTVTDQVRMGFKVGHPSDGDAIVRGLAARYETIDEGWQINAAGYFDRKVYVRFKDGMIGEVQVWEPSLYEAKEGAGQGHKLYVAYDDAMKAGDRKLAADLEQQMQDLYGSVIDALPDHWKTDPELGPAIQRWKASVGRDGSAPNRALNSAGDNARASTNGAPDLTSTQAPSRNAQASPGAEMTGTPSQSEYLSSTIGTSDGIIAKPYQPRQADSAADHITVNETEPPAQPVSTPTPDMHAHADMLAANGVTPEVARAAMARQGDYIGDVVPAMRIHNVTDAAGHKIEVQPVVVELRDLITSDQAGYDPALQPRDRTRAQSDEQIRKIVGEFDPERLGFSAEADRGAPIVGDDRQVESGNGRMMALREVYANHPEKADAYRAYLAGYGVDVGKFEQPVLVRQRLTPLTPEQRVDLTVNANKPIALGLGPAETAAADVKLLTPETLDLIRNADNLDAAANREFTTKFLSKLTLGDRSLLQDAGGGLNPAGQIRIRNALIAAAYGDSPILTRIAESTNDEVRGISKALAAAAPEWAKLRAEILAGHVRADMDLTPSLIEAVQKAAYLREQGIKLDAHLDQIGMFGDELSPEATDWLRMFYNPKGKRANGIDNMTLALRDYAEAARQVSASDLGLTTPTSPAKLQAHALEVAHAKFKEDGAQGSLLPLKSRRGGDGAGYEKGRGAQPGSEPGGAGGGAAGGGLRRSEGRASGNGPDAQLGVFDFSNPGGPSRTGAWSRDVWIGDTNISYSVKPGGLVEIGLIKTKDGSGGKGSARAALEAMARQADQEGLTLALSPEPMTKEVKKGRLTEFYKSVGFVDNKGKGKNFETRATMLRLPRDPGPRASFGEIAQPLRASAQPMTTRRGQVVSTTPADQRTFPQRRELPGEAQKPVAMPGDATPAEIRDFKITNEMMSIANDLGRKLEIDGRFTLRGALGEYKTQMGVLRIRHAGDLEVFAHELGHAIDQRLETQVTTGPRFAQMKRQFAADLKKLDPNTVNPTKQTTAEGVAEFLRMYVTNPAYAQKQASGFAQEFERLLAHDPELRDVLNRAQRISQIDNALSPTQALAAQVAPPEAKGMIARAKRIYQAEGITASLADMGDTVYANVVAGDHWVGKFVSSLRDTRFEKTGAPLPAGWKDPYQMFRMLPGAKQAAVDGIMNGVRPYGGHMMQGAVVAGLHEHLSLALGGRLSRLFEDGDPLVRDFNAYLIARRATQLWDRFNTGDLRNPPIGVSEAKTRASVGEFEAANPTFRQAADGVFAFTKAYWDKKFDAGLIPRDVYEAVNAQGHDYVPFMRDMTDKLLDGRGGASSSNGVSDNGLRKIKGSSRSIVSPIHAIMEDVAQTERMIAHNDTVKALHKLAQAGGEFSGRFLERVPNSELKGASVDLIEAIRSKARKEGADKADTEALIRAMEDLVGPDMTASIFRASDTTPKGERILFYWDGGERVALKVGNDELSRQFFDVFTALGSGERDLALAVIGKVNGLFSAMVTNAPEFGLKNLVMDNISRVFIGRNAGWLGRVPGAAIAMGIHTSLFDREFAKAYAAFGGIRGGLVSQAARTLDAASGRGLEHAMHPRTMKEMQAELLGNQLAPKNLAKTLAMTPFKAIEKLMKAIEYTETAGRLGQAKIVFAHLKKQGLDDAAALRGAFYEGRDILDYDRRGGSMGAASKLVPFLNAGIQGTDRALRNLAGAPIQAYLEAARRGGYASLDADTKSALFDAVKNWGMIAAGVGATAGYAFHMANDARYQKETDYMRRRYYIFYPGGDDKDGNPMKVTLPKPFDLPGSLMAATEFYIYGMIRQDPETYAKAAKNMLDGFVPRQFMGMEDLLGSMPVLKTGYEAATGMKMGFEGRNPFPIVPQDLKALPPEMQSDAYSSWLSKKIGTWFGVSPKKVEHVMDGLGATASRDVNAVLTAALDQNPRMTMGDAMTKFFFGGLYRQDLGGGQARSDVMNLMARDNGTYAQLAAGYRRAIETGDDKMAETLFNRGNDTSKTLMILSSDQAFKPEMRVLHPLVRTEKVGEVASGILRDLAGSKVNVEDRSRKRGELRETIPLEPSVARAISATVTSWMAEEMRNGLAAVKEPGYATYPLIDTSARLEAIRALSPDVADEIQGRLDKRKVIPIERLVEEWPKVKDLVLQDRKASAKELARTYKELAK